MRLSVLKDYVDVAQNCIATVAILIGGFWTWMLFVKNRLPYPRANIKHQISHKTISKNKVLLRVVIQITNSGDTLLSPESGFIRIQQVAPWPKELLEAIKKGNASAIYQDTELDWPLIEERKLDFVKKKQEIEPGEVDELCCDFIIDKVETVLVYSFVKNRIKRKKGVGWNTTSCYDFKTSKILGGKE